MPSPTPQRKMETKASANAKVINITSSAAAMWGRYCCGLSNQETMCSSTLLPLPTHDRLRWKGGDQMVYYTLVYKPGICPVWLDKVTITAKYRYSEDTEKPYSAIFVCAECEIVKNLHLPESKRDKRLELYAFCGQEKCPLLKGFPEEIDVRKP